jgi:hypothetical protein
VDVFGPACSVWSIADLASGASSTTDLAGSSMAAVWVGQAVALLCDLVPSLTGTDAEAALLASSRVVDGVRVLDVEAAARTVGAGGAVTRARARLDGPPTTGAPRRTDPPGSGPHVVPGESARFVRFAASWRRCRLRVRAESSRPAELRVEVRGRMPAARLLATRRTKGTTLSFALRPRPVRLTARLVPTAGSGAASPTIRRVVRPRRDEVSACTRRARR